MVKLREASRLALVLLVVGMMALALHLLGRVPACLSSSPTLKDYASLEAAEAELGFKITLPTYFPSYLYWPPSSIRGQLQPVPMVQIIFLTTDQSTEALWLTQIASDSMDWPQGLPWIKTILERIPVDIGGNQGELVVGQRDDGQLVNGVYWTTDGRHFAAVMSQPIREVLILARSMHP
ncbi:MAG: hypothetical protein HW402_165 [Dehalococcoidales bacterium]|nr:hypothetical protein [Dehalococcoidales bacterium]